MPRLPLAPRLLSPDDFANYAAAWQTLINGDNPEALNASLASLPGTFANYAYLPGSLVQELLSSGADRIGATFVLVPAKGGPVFSIALFPDQPNPPYYLAGLADRPAKIMDDKNEPIPADVAANWILQWHDLPFGQLKPARFDSPVAGAFLRGYTFAASDFRAPWELPHPPEPALWLNFDLHPQSEAPDAPVVFGTIVTLNSAPTAGQPSYLRLSPLLMYYDVAQACPPTCAN